MPSLDINTILGTTWFALCCRGGINLFRLSLRAAPSKSEKSLFWSVYAFRCLLALVGIVASIFLFFNGPPWACWLIGLMATERIFSTIVCIAFYKSSTIQENVVLVISLVSLALLFGQGLWHLPGVTP
jgi:hypothetical protein